MIRKNKLPELLSPAGDMQCLVAAVEAGADAVYVGGKAFGARAYAKNFDIDELSFASAYCKLWGVKLYVTVNTLVYDRELAELSDYVAELWRIGVDAVITADLGVISEIKRRAPGLEIHASTQMSVHNTRGADMAGKLGCTRAVLARELSYGNIKTVTAKSSVETEVFLHGALCVCHSGQCLMSSLVGGRSGNRGECAQPCRLPYNGKYPLSLADLSLAGHITELIDSGVASLKIEGRMKSPEYVYTVTKIYRRLLDEGRNATKDEIRRLEEVFSRGKFTDGYFVDKKHLAMTGIRSEQDKDKTRRLASMTFQPKRAEVRAECVIKRGEPSRFTLILGDRRGEALGAIPRDAISAPLDEDSVKERLCKMGGTIVSLDPCNVNLMLDEGLNLPPSAINSLRREAYQALISPNRPSPEAPPYSADTRKAYPHRLTTAVFFNSSIYEQLASAYPKQLASVDLSFLPCDSYVAGAEGVFIPPVVFDSEEEEVLKLLKAAREDGARYALVSNIGHISIANEACLIPVGDFRLNITNFKSREAYEGLGLSSFVLSPELTLPMVRDIGGGEIVYGRIPLMITERCFIKENFGCDKCKDASLVDRTKARFPIMRQYGHRNLILNSLPTYMGDRKADLKSAKITHLHLLFTKENAREAAEVLDALKAGASLGAEVRRIGKRMS